MISPLFDRDGMAVALGKTDTETVFPASCNAITFYFSTFKMAYSLAIETALFGKPEPDCLYSPSKPAPTASAPGYARLLQVSAIWNTIRDPILLRSQENLVSSLQSYLRESELPLYPKHSSPHGRC